MTQSGGRWGAGAMRGMRGDAVGTVGKQLSACDCCWTAPHVEACGLELKREHTEKL
jgi:hypothetical protein